MVYRTITQLAILFAVVMICASCGPRMTDQISIKPYESKMPAMPAGSVPTTGRLTTTTQQTSKTTSNPLPKTPGTLDDGRIYYGYYCAMCHGDKGDGNGPVGESFVPKPADLSSSQIATLSDGELYYRMLHGTGHDPVMDQTVLPNHRWPLVMYVRTFAHGGPPPKQMP